MGARTWLGPPRGLRVAEPPPYTAGLRLGGDPASPSQMTSSGTEALPGGQGPVQLGEGCPVGAGEGDGEPQKGGGFCSLGVSARVTRPCFAEKMAFVGFKGSFRPTWVTLDTEDHTAKIFQVVPIPVVRKQQL